MAAEIVTSDDSMKKRNTVINLLYWVIGILILVTLISLFTVIISKPSYVNNSSMVENNQSSQILEVTQEISMKPVELMSDMIASCNNLATNNEVQSYCSDFRKVSFDGLEMFVNCDYAEIKSQVSTPLSCSENQISSKEVCDKYQLNANEFVSTDGRVNTCAEASLK